jgi:hypothetical protein
MDPALDPAPYPDPTPDPSPDPTPFFNDLKDAKKKISSYIFLITCQQPHHLQSKNFILQALFQSAQHI